MISFALISSFRGWNNEIHIFIISYLTTVFLRLERIALSWLRIKSLTWSNTRRCLFRSILRFIKSNTLIPGPSQDEQAICNIIFTQKVMWETIIGSYLKHDNSDLVFQTRSIFLNEVRSWSRAQNVIFFKITSFWIRILHFNFKEMLMRSRGTINSSSESNYQAFIKIKAKIVLAAMLEGNNIIIQIQANTNHTDFLEKSKCHKIFP